MSGRKLEALKLYEDGCSELLKMCKGESNPETKKHYQRKLDEYLTQSEKIKKLIQSWGSKGEIRDRIHIAENATNYGFDRIFGKYLNEDVEEVLIEEPYVKDHYQLMNLVMFCELAVTNCHKLRCIKVTTNRDPSPNSEQLKGFNMLSESLQKQNVCLYVDLVTNLHDRQVLFNNGYIIKIGRGLNYFKPASSKVSLGAFNYNFRECRETNVDVLFFPENYKATK